MAGGRPKKEIDIEQLKKMCEIQCTITEISNIYDCDRNTITARLREHGYDSFSTFYKKYSDSGKKSLRRYQFDLAKKNAAMAIWLGKNLLGQKDNPLEIIQDNDNAKEPRITKNTPPTEAAKIYARMVKK